MMVVTSEQGTAFLNYFSRSPDGSLSQPTYTVSPTSILNLIFLDRDVTSRVFQIPTFFFVFTVFYLDVLHNILFVTTPCRAARDSLLDWSGNFTTHKKAQMWQLPNHRRISWNSHLLAADPSTKPIKKSCLENTMGPLKAHAHGDSLLMPNSISDSWGARMETAFPNQVLGLKMV